MWTKRLINGASVTLLMAAIGLSAHRVLAEQSLEQQFRVGPVYVEGPGEVAAVVELPYGVRKPDPSNFRLRIDGQDAGSASDVTTFLDSGKELAWLLCVDVSGTMRGGPLRDTKQALHSLVHDSRSLRIGLVTFGTEIRRAVDFEDTRDVLVQNLDVLQGEGRTSKTRLYQALYEALDYFEERMTSDTLPERKRILVISDGKDEGSSASAQSVILRSMALAIPIDAVARGRIDDQYTESLRHLADGTGGRFVHAQPDVVSLTDGLTRIYRELMETQTVVPYFSYQSQGEGTLSEQVGIELLRPGADSLKGFFGAAIPTVEVPRRTSEPRRQPDGTKKSWWVQNYPWLLAALVAALLAALLILVGRRRKLKGVVENDRKTPPHSDVSEPPVASSDSEQQQVPADKADPAPKRRRTQVGGYFPPPTVDAPVAILVGVGEVMRDQRFPVDKEVFHIGASPESDLFIEDDEYVSRNHAYLRYEKGSLLIVDQGSRNGTYVNNQRVYDVPHVVMPGDRIRVGTATFQIVDASAR